VTTLAERLGYGPEDRLLIVTAHDLGSSHAANEGVYATLRGGLASSASLMVPAPWSRAAAQAYRGEDIGVQLTLNSEFDTVRWGPITHAPSLVDGDGGFPRSPAELWEHADLDELRRECRTQIERAIIWGFDVSHLDSHLGALHMRPEFFDQYLEMAHEFQLPIRLPGHGAQRAAGFPMRELAAEEGILFPDHLEVVPGAGVGSRASIGKVLADLQPGVTEVYLHPAADTPELRALASDWANRVDDLHMATHDSDLRAMVKRSGAKLISYRELRDAQRAG